MIERLGQWSFIVNSSDDNVQKPIDLDGLLAKIQSLLRRTNAYGEEAPDVLYLSLFTTACSLLSHHL
ncbi:DNA-binding response OmpR family regulator [Sporosarcina sp. JAI121]|nr:DNA-binding response OmpR family regulator [Sporosarcina sp. JAI121]